MINDRYMLEDKIKTQLKEGKLNPKYCESIMVYIEQLEVENERFRQALEEIKSFAKYFCKDDCSNQCYNCTVSLSSIKKILNKQRLKGGE